MKNSAVKFWVFPSRCNLLDRCQFWYNVRDVLIKSFYPVILWYYTRQLVLYLFRSLQSSLLHYVENVSFPNKFSCQLNQFGKLNPVLLRCFYVQNIPGCAWCSKPLRGRCDGGCRWPFQCLIPLAEKYVSCFGLKSSQTVASSFTIEFFFQVMSENC